MAVGILTVRPISQLGLCCCSPANFYFRTRHRFAVYSFALKASSLYALPMTINVPIIWNMQYHKNIMYRTYFTTSVEETLIDLNTKLQKHAVGSLDIDGNNEYPPEGYWSDTGWSDIGAATEQTGIDGSVKVFAPVNEYSVMAGIDFARLVITITASSTWTGSRTLNCEGWANSWYMHNDGGRLGSIEQGRKPNYPDSDLSRSITTLRDF